MISGFLIITKRTRLVVSPATLNYFNERLENGIISKEEYESSLKQEDTMNRKEIINNHKPAIKQLSNGRYYTRIEGQTVQSIFKSRVEDAVIDYYVKRMPTLASIFEAFMHYSECEKTDATLYRYRLLFDKFIKTSAIADKPLIELRINDAKCFLDHCLSIDPDMKYKYWINLKSLLNRMFSYAMEMDYTSYTPFKNFNPSSKRFAAPAYHQEEDMVFSAEEKEKICDLAWNEARKQSDAVPLAIILLFLLGIRDGELCGLKWCDIESDKFGKSLHIQRMQVVQYKNGAVDGYKIVPYVKSEASNRRLSLSPRASALLEQVKQLNMANGINVSPNDLIFQRMYKEQFTFITTRSITPRLAKFCRKAGMTEIKSPHDIRRTFITELYERGLSLKKIQGLAGHSTLNMTLKYIKGTDLNEDDQKILNTL